MKDLPSVLDVAAYILAKHREISAYRLEIAKASLL